MLVTVPAARARTVCRSSAMRRPTPLCPLCPLRPLHPSLVASKHS
jgi:hypothetical protein